MGGGYKDVSASLVLASSDPLLAATTVAAFSLMHTYSNLYRSNLQL